MPLLPPPLLIGANVYIFFYTIRSETKIDRKYLMIKNNILMYIKLYIY